MSNFNKFFLCVGVKSVNVLRILLHMLQKGRKEKRLLHFSFHATGAAKGSFRSNVQMSFFVSNVTVIKQ